MITAAVSRQCCADPFLVIAGSVLLRRVRALFEQPSTLEQQFTLAHLLVVALGIADRQCGLIGSARTNSSASSRRHAPWLCTIDAMLVLHSDWHRPRRRRRRPMVANRSSVVRSSASAGSPLVIASSARVVLPDTLRQQRGDRDRCSRLRRSPARQLGLIFAPRAVPIFERERPIASSSEALAQRDIAVSGLGRTQRSSSVKPRYGRATGRSQLPAIRCNAVSCWTRLRRCSSACS